MKVELDKKALFALASDSRMEILKELQPSRRTVTQLAEALDIDKGAVHRHLKKLEEGGLVVRYDEHGFVYYGLSWKARDIVSPGENTRIIITFAVSALMALSTIGAVFLGFSQQRNAGAGQSSPTTTGNATGPLISSGVSWEWIVLAIVLGAAAVGLAYLACRWIWRPKQDSGIEKEMAHQSFSK
ncbi:MAG: winged helix-turn-helix domain-containing protein [Methanomassiliicoccales archaeon]|jgi:DNA-binding transcriptional ArsR family regulator